MSEWCKQCDAVLTWDGVVGTFAHSVWEILLVLTLWVSGPCWEVQGSCWGREEAPQEAHIRRGQALQKQRLSFWSLYLFVQNLPQLCMCTFILVLYSFFVLCCLRRNLSRCKHCSIVAEGPRSRSVSFPLPFTPASPPLYSYSF